MKNHLFYCFCALTFILSCEQVKTSPQNAKIKVIVLCDASNSTTLQSSINVDKKYGRLDMLKQYVKAIPKWNIYPLGTEFYYFPISENLLSDQIGKISYKIKMQSDVRRAKTTADEELKIISQKIDSLSIVTRNSCILTSINRAINYMHELQSIDKDPKTKYELIIISDMIECCRYSDEVEIKMSAYNTAKLDNAIKEFEKLNRKFDLTGLNLKVSVLINSTGMANNYSKLEAIWKDWFKKIGIDQTNTFFYTNYPDVELNPILIN